MKIKQTVFRRKRTAEIEEMSRYKKCIQNPTEEDTETYIEKSN